MNKELHASCYNRFMVMEKLAAGLEKLGIKAGEHELALFQTYYEELTDWNQRMNLTAITEYEKVQINCIFWIR